MTNQRSEPAGTPSPLDPWLPPPRPDTKNDNRRITDFLTAVP